MTKAQGDYSFTLLLFFGLFFLSLIALGYFYLYDVDIFSADKCNFSKGFGCKQALAPQGFELEIINLYGMDIKEVRLQVETTNQSKISCHESKAVGDLGNTVSSPKQLLCKPLNGTYTEGDKLRGNLLVTFQDPLIGYNERTFKGELLARVKINQSTLWDKVFGG